MSSKPQQHTQGDKNTYTASTLTPRRIRPRSKHTAEQDCRFPPPSHPCLAPFTMFWLSPTSMEPNFPLGSRNYTRVSKHPKDAYVAYGDMTSPMEFPQSAMFSRTWCCPNYVCGFQLCVPWGAT
ncbi:hypothetical protein ACJQWK_10513 [Exserohilum turcicum]